MQLIFLISLWTPPPWAIRFNNYICCSAYVVFCVGLPFNLKACNVLWLYWLLYGCQAIIRQLMKIKSPVGSAKSDLKLQRLEKLKATSEVVCLYFLFNSFCILCNFQSHSFVSSLIPLKAWWINIFIHFPFRKVFHYMDQLLELLLKGLFKRLKSDALFSSLDQSQCLETVFFEHSLSRAQFWVMDFIFCCKFDTCTNFEQSIWACKNKTMYEVFCLLC